MAIIAIIAIIVSETDVPSAIRLVNALELRTCV